MNPTTLKLVKEQIQKRLRDRMERNPDLYLSENLIDAVCLDCINTVLTLELQRQELMEATKLDKNILGDFLGLIEREVEKETEEEEKEEES